MNKISEFKDSSFIIHHSSFIIHCMSRIFLISVGLLFSVIRLTAQGQQDSVNLTKQSSSVTTYIFTMEDVIQLAKEQSLQAIMARHYFRASYFSFVDYKANFLPKLTLTANPVSWDHSIRTVTTLDDDGNMVIKETPANTFSSTATLSLSQNIGLTGGSVSLGSDFQRRQNMLEKESERATTFTTYPVRLSVYQPLNGYNQFTWLKKIEPLRFEEAKQNYIVQMEYVSSTAVNRFFSLAIAQVILKMEEMNFENAQTLYQISKGRHEAGNIAEDELLRMYLRLLQAEGDLNNARVNIESSEYQLRSFLGFKEYVKILLEIDPEIPNLVVPHEQALDYAMSRNPSIISYNRRILEDESKVAQAKSQKGITLTMNAAFGMNKTGYRFEDAYSTPFDNSENINVGIRVPILDWSQSRNRLRNAESLLEATKLEMEQNETDFMQEIRMQVTWFNMQKNQLRIAAVRDTIAQQGYKIAYQRYLVGKVNVTDLNISDSEKNSAKRNFMNELQKYWNYYFLVRRLTLFDFLNNKPIEEDFNLIIGEL